MSDEQAALSQVAMTWLKESTLEPARRDAASTPVPTIPTKREGIAHCDGDGMLGGVCGRGHGWTLANDRRDTMRTACAGWWSAAHAVWTFARQR